MINFVRYFIFMKRVMNNEFLLNDEEAAQVLNCAPGSLRNFRGGDLMLNVHYIKTFGSEYLYSKKALLKSLAKKSWKARKK